MTNHTDTSRSGDLVERLRQVSSVLFDDYGDGTHAVEDYALPGKAAALIEKLEADNAQMRGLLGEAEVKLTDVQGAYATKRYADNLLARIRAALAKRGLEVREIEG